MIPMIRRLPLVSILLFTAALAGQERKDEGILVQECRALLSSAAPEKDEPFETAREILALIEKDKASPVGEALAMSLVEVLRDRPVPAPLLERIAALVEDRSLHGLTALRLLHLLAEEENALLRTRDADRHDPATQYAAHFMIAGPFGDGGSFFHGIRFPPEQGSLDPGVQMDGRFGKVHWQKLVRSPASPTVNLERKGPRETGCWYGLHQVDVPDVRTAYLQIQGGGSYEVFVNGRKVLDVNRVAGRPRKRDFVPVFLRKGRNHVLLKCTSPWATSISLRYCDGAGRTMSDLKEEEGARILPCAAGSAEEKPPAPFQDGSALLSSRAGTDRIRPSVNSA